MVSWKILPKLDDFRVPHFTSTSENDGTTPPNGDDMLVICLPIEMAMVWEKIHVGIVLVRNIPVYPNKSVGFIPSCFRYININQ